MIGRPEVWLAGLALVAALLGSTPARADLTTTTFMNEWGTKSPNGNGEFYYTVMNAVHDATGDVYTIEANKLQKFDANGTFLYDFHCDCAGIDVSQVTGDVYVSRNKVDDIQQYTAAGVFVRSWGSFGTGPGQFDTPWGVTVDSNTGNVYVMDSSNARVQIFDTTGVYLSEFTSTLFNGKPGEPGGIAFDPVGNFVWVTQASSDQAEKFDAWGIPQFRLGVENDERCIPGMLRWVRSVAIDSLGNPHFTRTDCESIEAFDSSGTWLESYMGPGNLIDGPFHPRDIAINRLTDEKYVNAAYAAREDKFDATNQYLFSWGGRRLIGHYMLQPRGIAISPTSGDVYVFDSNNIRLKRFTAGGAFLNQWGESRTIDPTAPGLFGSFGQNALAVDAAGDVWAGITGLHYADGPVIQYVQKFDPQGNHLLSFLRPDLTGKYSENVPGVDIDPVTGDVWISDKPLKTVKKYDASGTLLLQFGSFTTIAGIAASDTHVYVADVGPNKIFKFDKTGAPGVPAEFGSAGAADGQFLLDSTSNIEVDSAGNVYVPDTRNDRIQMFDGNGNFVAKFGVSGNGVGEFLQPMGVSLSADDNLMHVVDRGRNKVVSFCLNPTLSVCSAAMDIDSDTVLDFPDNCPFLSNTAQDDNGGLGTASADGIGDDCQCGEVDDTGDITGTDLSALRDFLVGVGGPIASDRCSVIGATECDVVDAAVLARALTALEPGLSQVCAPALP